MLPSSFTLYAGASRGVGLEEKPLSSYHADMDGDPFFSLILLILEDTRFISLSLDSIASQDFASFEVLVFVKKLGEKDRELLSSYALLPMKVHDVVDANLGKTANLAVEMSRGDYLHFFLPGEKYLWDGALQELHAILLKDRPDLFCSSTLARVGPFPEVIQSRVYFWDLKIGETGAYLNAVLFSRSLFSRYFLFDASRKYHPGFDFLVKIAKVKNLQVHLARKVYIDKEIEQARRNESLGEYIERFWIILRHFGIRKALLFFFRALIFKGKKALMKAKALFR